MFLAARINEIRTIFRVLVSDKDDTGQTVKFYFHVTFFLLVSSIIEEKRG